MQETHYSSDSRTSPKETVFYLESILKKKDSLNFTESYSSEWYQELIRRAWWIDSDYRVLISVLRKQFPKRSIVKFSVSRQQAWQVYNSRRVSLVELLKPSLCVPMSKVLIVIGARSIDTSLKKLTDCWNYCAWNFVYRIHGFSITLSIFH